MTRFLISTTESLQHDLKLAAESRGQTLTGLIRQILYDWAKQNAAQEKDG